ncbi:Uncharacterized protein TCM_013246 [Theobroma cacao]|uniref:Uncharacterized protein n=1 Tax=Theobroma cacao TaxID=3641 RepID=A0A061FW96_THECC|nr:Uncharacterized protein TCM_013246 [Theobroma cacao]
MRVLKQQEENRSCTKLKQLVEKQIINQSKVPTSALSEAISTDGIKALQVKITGGISATVPTFHHPCKHTNSHKRTEIKSTS